MHRTALAKVGRVVAGQGGGGGGGGGGGPPPGLRIMLLSNAQGVSASPTLGEWVTSFVPSMPV